MDHAEDKEHWNQHCQSFADLSLGLSEDVGEWTNDSEIIVMFQFFNSIDFFMKEIYR